MPRKTQLARWNEKWIEVESGCHEWQAAKNQNGYGNFWDATSRQMRGAHRVGWEMLIGPIPPGMELDHICKNTSCVNMAHLRIVTGSFNTMYGHGSTEFVCKHGHVGHFKDRGKAGRLCVPCSRITAMKWHNKNKERRHA